MVLLYKSLVRSKLEYCCPLWHSRNIADIQMIESVQRTFTSKIIGMEGLNYWGRLKKLRLMSLQRRRERYIIFYLWKVIHGHYTNELNFEFRFSDRRGIVALVKPIINHNSKAQTLYDSLFAVMAAKLWNILDGEITLHTDFFIFKAAVDKYLSTFSDKPPIQGYYHMNDNSLISLTHT